MNATAGDTRSNTWAGDRVTGIGIEVGSEVGVADGWIEGVAVGLTVISGVTVGLGAGGQGIVQAASVTLRSTINTRLGRFGNQATSTLAVPIP